jgi:hypothetical protein
MNADKLFLIMAPNEGDTLNSIQTWKIKIRRQDVKPDPQGRTLRARLLGKGIAHSFYKEYLWALPINERKVGELNLIEIISENFLRWGEEEVQEINNFTSDELWYPVGIVLLRDAIRYALWVKLKDQKDFVIHKREVYDKRRILYSGVYTYVILGVSFDKILRMDYDNVCLCPEIVYECYDSLNRLVEDRFERQKNILLASRCSSKVYCERLELMIKNIFPLELHLSNKTLKFNSLYCEISGRKEKIKQTGLEEWL